MENFQIRSYGKSELALCYSPDITESAARRKLMRWIDRKPGLMGAMRAAGYNELSHTFLPLEVKLIVEALGEPLGCWKIHGNAGDSPGAQGDPREYRHHNRRCETQTQTQQTQVLFSHTRARTLYMHVRVFSLLPLFF